jgi:murein DD-endopeptidase MepM/ murein hydrolase activator NlpD
MRRRIARWQTRWFWLFLLAVPAARLVRWPVVAEVLATGVPLALAFVRPPRRDRPPVELAAPVRGRWVALNSPGSKVPSHGLRAYGQTYAIDVLRPSPPGADTRIGWGLRTRRPQEYPCFGESVSAVADGTVVGASGTQRDHRGRDTWPALLLMLTVEAMVREVRGTRGVLGNHLIIDLGDGTFAGYAHLRRGSLLVGPGDRVSAGQQIAEVGNTGNTSEPHLHFQLMDRPRPTAAAGIPWRWTDIEAGGLDPRWAGGDPHQPARPGRAGRRAVEGVPTNGQIFTVRRRADQKPAAPAR